MEFIEQYKYSIAGAVIALILALLILSFGFFKTIFLLLIVALGAYLGNQLKSTGILEKAIADVKQIVNQKK
ncbi:DUF2273 domain-containing protein [Streptococcus fryi]